MKLLATIFVPVAILFAAFSHHDSEPTLSETLFTLEASVPGGDVKCGDEVNVQLVLSTNSEEPVKFQLGSTAQVFGIYILGPWSSIEPDSTKVRPENWMHQQHSSSTTITLTKNKPFRMIVKLSDYYNLTDSDKFRPGKYQVNVKFYEIENKMSAPIDSGPVHFTILQME